MYGDPVAASVHVDVRWEWPVAHAPHVVVTFYERSVQTLLHDEPDKQTNKLTNAWTSIGEFTDLGIEVN